MITLKKVMKATKRKQAIMVKGFQELGWLYLWKQFLMLHLYLWLPIPPRYNSAFEFCEDLLKKSGIVVVPGNAFGDYGEGTSDYRMYVRMNSFKKLLTE
jgi:LL-diaminopimelate aminotransferase